MIFGAVVLAAGRGTRMRSVRPKVLHHVAGRPMVAHVLDAAAAAADDLGVASVETAIVVGHRADDVRRAVEQHLDERTADDDPASSDEPAEPPEPRATDPVGTSLPSPARLLPTYSVQDEQLGTGHAALQAAAEVAGKAPTIVILYGDTPLLRGASIARLLRRHAESGATLSLLTARVDEPAAYGRVVRGEDGRVERIVEAKHASAAEREIDEVNTGVYAVSDAWLWDALRSLAPTPGGEIYLTDLVASAAEAGEPIEAVEADDALEFLGVDTRARLARAEGVLRDRIRAFHLEAGVTMIDPSSTWIDAGVEIGQDTELWPETYLLGRTRIGQACRLGPGTVLRDSRLDDGAVVERSVIEGSRVGAGCSVGPYSHLRPGTILDAGSRVGNFAEIKGSRLGSGSRMGHFGYVGDASVGEGVNIGAGTVTCNFDGEKKGHTHIGSGAFIGSDTMLVAPVTIGEGARTGAGSVVTRDVAPGTTVAGVPARPLRSSDTGDGSSDDVSLEFDESLDPNDGSTR